MPTNWQQVLFEDPEWKTLTDTQIARHCGVHQTFVSKLNRDLKSNLLRNGSHVPVEQGSPPEEDDEDDEEQDAADEAVHKREHDAAAVVALVRGGQGRILRPLQATAHAFSNAFFDGTGDQDQQQT